MTSSRGKKGDGGDDAGDGLWARETADVRPLPRDGEKPPRRRRRSAVRRMEADVAPASLSSPGSAPSEKPPAGREIDRRTAEKLQRGALPIEARIDLHGMTQDRARAAVTARLKVAHSQGQRLVLVITGKGSGASPADSHMDKAWWEDRPGVLRQRVPEWLSSPPLDAIVLRAVPAQPRDGGDGALYVYLRRRSKDG